MRRSADQETKEKIKGDEGTGDEKEEEKTWEEAAVLAKYGASPELQTRSMKWK